MSKLELEAAEERKRLESVREGLSRKAGFMGIQNPQKAERSIRLLKRIGGNTAIEFIGAIGSIRAHVAFGSAVDALISINSERSLKRLSYIAHDERRLAMPVVEALVKVATPEVAMMVTTIAERNPKIAVETLDNLLNLKEIFTRKSKDPSNIDRCIERVTHVATEPVLIESSPNLREVLDRAIQTIPSLGENKQVQSAIEKLGALSGTITPKLPS